MSDYSIPDYFAEFIADYFGAEGAAWLAALPALLAEYEPPLGPLAAATLRGADLQLCHARAARRWLPGRAEGGCAGDEFRASIAFLRLCEGRGAVRLLEADPEHCVMPDGAGVPRRAAGAFGG